MCARSKFWEEYFSYWDEVIRDWCEKKGKAEGEPRNLFGSGNLMYNELPEPYILKTNRRFPQGDVKAIMINFNPGASTELECAKCFCRNEIDPKGGELLQKLIGECKGSYRRWVSRYGCLLNKYYPAKLRSRIPGVEWWQGRKEDKGNGGRMRWINQFYQQLHQDSVSPEEVFALELCPYHSKCAPTGMFSQGRKKSSKDDELLEFEWERVFKPSIVAACENGVPCIVCVGKGVINAMKRCLGDDVKRVGRYDRSKKSIKRLWPSVEDGGAEKKLVYRGYELYKFRDGRHGRWADIAETVSDMPDKIYVLGVWAQGSIKLPDENFVRVEKIIVKKINGDTNKARRKTGSFGKRCC